MLIMSQKGGSICVSFGAIGVIIGNGLVISWCKMTKCTQKYWLTRIHFNRFTAMIDINIDAINCFCLYPES